MNNFFKVLFVLSLTAGFAFGQLFDRVAEIPLPADESSFGNMISGVDFDGDGNMEIYAVNNNWSDGGISGELVPKIYKYEFVPASETFEMVWSAVLDIPKQNTWPALTYGDLDQDNKMEIYWGPVNFTDATNANPSRVVVFETAGDGSDVMGVSDGNGNYLPNAQWSIVDEDNANHRPFRWVVSDVDNDSVDELVFCTRAGSMRYGVISVSDIPDNGDGSEEWTLEASDMSAGAVTGSTTYDMAVMNNTIYLLHDGGDVTAITNDGSTYTVQPIITGLLTGSWNSATVVDIDEDDTDEMLVASWSSSGQNVYLVEGEGANITATIVADLSGLVGSSARLYGGAVGDIDQDGNIDYVVGTRDATPNAAIARVKYIGGDIAATASYESTLIDQEFQSSSGRWMHINVANVDGDPNHEVLYSEGTGSQAPIVIIDSEGTLPVELTSFSASIKDGAVNLVWETATELNNYGFEIQRKAEGSEFTTVSFIEGFGTSSEKHSYSFADRNLAFGTYSYRLKQIDYDGNSSFSDVVEVDFSVPVEFNLAQNFPNPFNPSTSIKFGIPEEASVSLKIFNMLGEEVAVIVNNEVYSAGTHTVQFNASNLPSGTYVYALSTGNKVLTNKMVLLK